MLPEVEKFHEQIKKAQEAYNEAGRTPAAFTARRTARIAAWDELQTSDNKVVAYIAEHQRRNYRDEAIEVLDALPMTEAELEKFGDDKGWCSVFSNWMDSLRDAGALPGYVPLSPARQAFVEYAGKTITNPKRAKKLLALLEAALAEPQPVAEPQDATVAP